MYVCLLCLNVIVLCVYYVFDIFDIQSISFISNIFLLRNFNKFADPSMLSAMLQKLFLIEFVSYKMIAYVNILISSMKF